MAPQCFSFQIGAVPFGGLDVFDHLASLEAGGANANALGGAIDERTHRLEVGIPTTVGDVMSVADIVAKLGFFTANFTLTGHGDLSWFPGTALPKEN